MEDILVVMALLLAAYCLAPFVNWLIEKIFN
jgi:hypothetical protein